MIIVLFYFLFIIGLPIIFSFLIYNWVKKKGFDKKFRLLSAIPIVAFGYFVLGAFFPSSEFYETDFEEVVNFNFPESGRIIFKTASFPDHFGDYTSSFLIELDSTNIELIEAQLISIGFQERESEMASNELEFIENKKGVTNYSKNYVFEPGHGKYYSVGFLNDNSSLIITRISW